MKHNFKKISKNSMTSKLERPTLRIVPEFEMMSEEVLEKMFELKRYSFDRLIMEIPTPISFFNAATRENFDSSIEGTLTRRDCTPNIVTNLEANVEKRYMVSGYFIGTGKIFGTYKTKGNEYLLVKMGRIIFFEFVDKKGHVYVKEII
ncbi:MAG: hypothetical protein PF542_05525 [Nanoarchaeota archaeon]|jgi:hypothetical protein|nr:hypothetical protein [Nanoarchaeota archaeon]